MKIHKVQSKNIIETLAFGSLAPLMAHANMAPRWYVYSQSGIEIEGGAIYIE